MLSATIAFMVPTLVGIGAAAACPTWAATKAPVSAQPINVFWIPIASLLV
jgi:hypothetical protein